MTNYKRLSIILFITVLGVVFIWYTWWSQLKTTRVFMKSVKNIEKSDSSDREMDISQVLERFERAEIEVENINCSGGKIQVHGVCKGDLEDIINLIENVKGNEKTILENFTFENNQCFFSLVFYDAD